MTKDKFSSVANGIIKRRNKALHNANKEVANDMKKNIVCEVQPKKIREQLNMSQNKFATTFGIPLTTLQGWEQDRRQMDQTVASYFKAIMKIPNEIQKALSE